MPDGDDSFLARWSRRKAEARGGPGSGPAAPADAKVLTPAGSIGAPNPAAPAAAPRPVPATAPQASDDTTAATMAAATSPPPADSTPPRGASDSPVAPPSPPPTLADVAALTRESDYARFVAGDVAPEVKHAALRKLFSDPQFNVMDGLDTYIDDYGKPDPLPPGMLRKMVQSQLLGLFADAPEASPNADLAAGLAEGPSDAPDAAPDDSPHAASAAAPPDAAPGTSPDAAPDRSATAAVAEPPAPGPLATLAPEEAAPDEDADLQLQPDDAARRPGAGPDPGPHSGRGH